MVNEAVKLLKEIIAIPSVTFEEDSVAGFLYGWLGERADKLKEGSSECSSSFDLLRFKNNILAIPHSFTASKPTLMLNAHIDTVNAAESYTVDPYGALEKDGAIFGLGSNDDGGCVVSMIYTFLHFINASQIKKKESANNINIVLLLSAEEERSGAGGISYAMDAIRNNNIQENCSSLPDGFKIDFAIVGEPTSLRAAVAERGLLVIDAVAHGVSGHAARNEGVNAIYKALTDIEILRNYNFEKVSPVMGNVKLTVTQINAGTAHNVVPDNCSYVVDIRPTEKYSNTEIMELLQKEVESRLKARNLKNRSSATPQEHILMKAVEICGIEKFVSPTTSDWMKLTIPAIKIGPGDSARSHKADEYIKIDERAAGIELYRNLICNIDEIVGNCRDKNN